MVLSIAFSRIRFIPSYNPYLLQLIQKIIHELRKIVAVNSQIFIGSEQHQFFIVLNFSRRIVAVDGAIKAMCTRLEVVDLSNR